MSRRYIYFGSFASFSFEPETIDYMNAISIPNDSTIYYSGTAQEITGSAIWTAVNNFAIALKNEYSLSLGANNLSTYFPAIWLMIGGTATTHKFNLIDPQDTDAAYRLSFNGGITHSRTGADPNGSNAFADTFFNLRTYRGGSSTANVDQFSFGYYSRENIFTNHALMGSFDGTVSTRIMPNAFGAEYSAINNAVSTSAVSSRTDKLILVTRNGSSGGNSSVVRYRDATQYGISSQSTASLTNNNNKFYLFGQRNASNVLEYPTANECALSFISNVGMSSTRVTAVTTAINNLQSALFRNV
jgi:hypothetical protein